MGLLYCRHLDNKLHSRLFNLAVTLVVILYSCFTHLAVLRCTISILLIKHCWCGSHTTVVYSSVGHTSVEYAVAFTSGSHWYKVLLTKLSILVTLFIMNCLDMMGPCHDTSVCGQIEKEWWHSSHPIFYGRLYCKR